MKFTIFSHVNHVKKQNKIYGYAPYIREMNLWIKNLDSVEVVANLSNRDCTAIDLAYEHKNISFTSLPAFNLLSFKSKVKFLAQFPGMLYTIYKAMKAADHIHLRCPGNVGLLACFVQIFFPNKPKTAKYAGNWDPNANQPFSYKLQKWILNNTFLTKNMQVLVYGNWPNTSQNIIPFFTATYTEQDAVLALNKPAKKIETDSTSIKFLFVGTLSSGKRPLYALQLFHKLLQKKSNLELHFYGEGSERNVLEQYITKNHLQNNVYLHGNQQKEVVEKAYQESHFLILASKSEGWPKVVAEAMFWGCIPLTTSVSCVHQMIGNGERGVLLHLDLDSDYKQVADLLTDSVRYAEMSKKAKIWSTQYTLDKFDDEIQKLLSKSKSL
ncbi:glycosyltransferase [Flavobacterium agricola]|uniref:Glycosyltransferase n=1 Tax=Flavobacterium agricola TaxID=2870839 RepID=A0ABY6M053_9FLAO|nr:glycosyltransferase [Flavobacterium agricola]UYW00501.1 glycosyltransferase [Flavobacterium agricola]